MNTTDYAFIESLIDVYSLPVVLETIGDICNEKADHIAGNWQDNSLASIWLAAGALVHTAAGRKNVNRTAGKEQ
jgi:hypothetical protein